MPGVYISYPFCTQKCSFCNFASDVSPLHIRERYEQVLLDKVKTHQWSWLPETVYFGGGTPSLMPLQLLHELMDAIPHENLAETTLECAPGTLNSVALTEWRKCGVNRVSLGVQSFEVPELRRTGRNHTAETVQQDVQALRAAGITNINIDLIAGLPEQTLGSWNRSLAWIERLQPPHVSIYIFEVDEDSRLGNEVLLGGVRYGANLLPNDDLTAELYEIAVDRLARLGLSRYEISNFARLGSKSRHNLKYWLLEPYIGFGLDAHSFDGTVRWSNPDTLESYLVPDRAATSQRTLSQSEEHFFVGLRLMSGIKPTPQEWNQFSEPIAKWTRLGLLQREGSRLRLAGRGVLLSNEIFQDFIP